MQLSKSIPQLLAHLTLMLCGLNIAFSGELPTEPILRFDLGEHTAGINRIASDAEGRWLITASDDKAARVWDLRDGRLLSTLRIPIGTGNEGKLMAVALSPDGQTVALGGWTQVGDDDASIFLLDRASGHLLRRITGLPNVILHIAFSPDGRALAASFGSNNGIRLFSVMDGRLLAQDKDYAEDSYSVSFSHSGSRLVATSIDGYLRLYGWNGATMNLLSKQTVPGGKYPLSARFSPDGKQIAVGFIDTPAVNVLNAADLSFAYAPDTAGVSANLGSVAWTEQGLMAAGQAQKIFFLFWQPSLRHWQGNTVQDTPLAQNMETVNDLVALPAARLAYSTAGSSWGVVDKQGKSLLMHSPVIADFRGSEAMFSLSADGVQVRFSYALLGVSPAVFDSQRQAFVAGKGLNTPILSAAGLNITDSDSEFPKLNGALIKLKKHESSRCVALLPNSSGFAMGTDWQLILFNRDGTQRWQKAAPNTVWAVNVSADGRWVVAAYGDGTIRWHRASDGVEQLAFFPHADKQRWVMWTPSGYFDASPGAEDLIGWHVNNGKDKAADFFPVSRFRERFNRPDILAKVFETQDEAEAVRLANEAAGRRTTATTIAQVLPPIVTIVSPAAESTVQSNKVKVRYTVRTAVDTPVTAMRVRVNGLLQSDTRALKLVKSNDDEQEVEVTIPEQNAEIQLFAENKFSTSTPAILRLKWGGKTLAKQAKPKLYVLAVGVSKYKNPEYNLGLAAKDANDFVNSLQGQKGKLYSDVVVKLLTDDKATKDDVLDGLDWLKQQVTSNDVGIMFVAGHGMNDKLGGYYFMPHNADPEKLARTGVSQSDIKQAFASLPGHTVFFIDTCYSGGVMGNVRTSGFVNDLASAENGAVVFTASSAGQLSQENSAWGNGAFTKSVVEGLNGSADFRKSGFITAKGLDYYVDDRVKTLTNGQQTPVSIAPSGVTDFPIAVVGR